MNHIRPSTPQDEEQIIEMIARAFSVAPTVRFLEPRLLRWKYWTECGAWPEPRSWVVERGGRVVAHGAVWPVRTGPANDERGSTMLDWAADTKSSGAGVALMKMLRGVYPFAYCIGGTAMTQSILPRVGFQTIGEAQTWVRPLRPWRRLVRHQPRNWRAPIKAARNAWWSLAPPKFTGGRAAVAGRAGDPADVPVPLMERDQAFMHFLTECPVARFLVFHILDEGRRVGWFALAAGKVQARVAGIWLEHSSAENWRSAFHLAQRAALRYTDAYEIAARCGSPESSAGAEQAGMRVRKRVPVFFYRRDGGSALPPLHYQLCDDDAIFLNIDAVRFLS
jgi:hypothetical protein